MDKRIYKLISDLSDMVKYGFFIVGGLIFVILIQIFSLMLEGKFNLILQVFK